MLLIRNILCLPLAFLLFSVSPDGARAGNNQTIFGLWEEPDWRAQVRLYPCGRELCGTLVHLPEDAPRNDRNNPNPAQRDRSLIGLQLIDGFRRADDAGTSWFGGGEQGNKPGRIYVPSNGDTLGDAENAYIIELTTWDTVTIGVKNCLLSCVFKSTWQRVRNEQVHDLREE